MIEIKGVSKTFVQRLGGSYQALDNITLTIEKGEFVSLLGPSGCGKSTVLNLVAGFDTQSDGVIQVNGKKVTGAGADRVVVFQEHGLFPWLTVLDNVAFGLKQKGIGKKERYELAMEQIKAVHLSRFTDRYPHELSGGMKQRAAIARALAMDPEILLMDEPFAALDEQTRLILHKELEEIWMRTRKTILFITHNIREAVILSDRVFVMSTRPGTIKKEFAVKAARPRDSADTVLHHVENSIMDALADELEKVVREETGDEYSIKKNDFSGTASDSLGGGI
ncbi:NitT/TauT family transport system ATP-binding protein [Paenibacillus sp. V4I3]|uniref:ABC transporter ATP-binding protein n=1 Tax=unclassified Paenibacillus TaxID=185978 RepID=UPI00070B3030|nr:MULTISPECIES: ABC transporter ATP-binding protein [unclassified Paenibacillus]KQX67294.1 nitrate/sulfonate/bicarbonate ABC transporter ATP-binding protein [Paenibacillus sp. Root444D2]MDQ0873061.1 NitT/TauT family transport system ATP-binding protein [Paenibacillus sp. V4I3]MDQ0891021.1 NitT/TauT family transport system ATP-binding protein [Paenibacillus sp. V4I9]